MDELLKKKIDENMSQTVVGREIKATFCKSCVFQNGGTADSDAPEKAHCLIFQSPGAVKPLDVLYEGAACPAYMKQ